MAVYEGADMLLLDGNRANVREQIRHEVIGLLTRMAPVIEKEQHRKHTFFLICKNVQECAKFEMT